MSRFKLVVAILACALSTTAAAEEAKPNIIFILSDDVGTGDIKCFHKPSKVTTPNIDKLASQGMRFTQAYAPGSVCSPSRYALMTGAYPCRGPLRDRSAKYSSPLTIDEECVTLPRFLKSKGYRTAHIGKWHLGYGEKGIHNWAGEIKPGAPEIGFDYHLGLPANHNDNFKTYVENHRLLWLKDGVTDLPTKPTKEHLTRIRYDDEVDSTLTAKAIEFIEAAPHKPFFVYLALVATHTHITPHKRFRGTSRIGQLGDYINEMDYHVGEIMDTLDRLGIADNTILFFSSDNGGQSSDHHTAGKNLDLRDASQDVAPKSKSAKTDARTKHGHKTSGIFRGGKGSNYEGGFRVPFIVRWPGKVPAGRATDEMISLADILATTAGLLGEALPDSAGPDSFDLSPVMLGKEVKNPIRATVISQTGKGLLAYRSGDWKIRFTKKPRWTNEGPVLADAPEGLYHLATDPSETADLAKKQPERLAAMRKELLQLLKAGRSR